MSSHAGFVCDTRVVFTLGLRLLLLFGLGSCKAPASVAGLDPDGAAQSARFLHVKTVSVANAPVYELDQRRGALVNTLSTIQPGTMLVTLPWGDWDIIRTDPLRMVRQTYLSASQGQCPLSTYAFNRFHGAADIHLHGERLGPQPPSSVATALIPGPRFTIADSLLGVVAKSTHAMTPQLTMREYSASEPTWMPSQAQTWFRDLQVEDISPVVDDNAFLDFAACYVAHQPDLVPSPTTGPIGAVHSVMLPNGQYMMLNFRGRTWRPGVFSRFDAGVYDIDRDVLHFGVVAAARNATAPTTNETILLGKRYFGLEVGALGKLPAYKSTPPSEKEDVIESIVKHIALTETGWKLAIFQLLFNDPEHFSIQNQIFTGSGEVVLIDHEAPDPFHTAVPCLRIDVTDDIEGPARQEARRHYDNDSYEEFEALVREWSTFRIVVEDDGVVYDATQFYAHLRHPGAIMPAPLQRTLAWILEHRSETEPVVKRFYNQWAERREDDVATIESLGTCLFYARIAWLSTNRRLPSEAEGASIMYQCGLQPQSTCEMEFY